MTAWQGLRFIVAWVGATIILAWAAYLLEGLLQ